MAFNDIERKRLENTLAAYIEQRRPPAPVRPQLDLCYRLSGHSVELCEVRPDWKDPAVSTTRAYAKATYVKTQDVWKIYWMRADLKWHAYQPQASVKALADFLALVDADAYGCFCG